MRSQLEIKDRKYHLKSYSACFLGSDAVKVRAAFVKHSAAWVPYSRVYQI